MKEDFRSLLEILKKCEICKEKFGFKPHPIFLGNENSKIVQISQAPSATVHQTLKPFTDQSGKKLKYEWNKILVEKITKILDENNLSYYISNRYSSNYSIDEDLNNLKNCKIYLTCYDENEPDLDSTILQGFAYYNKKYIVGYESNPVKYYVPNRQEFGVSLMLEQSCDILTKSLEETVNEVLLKLK